MWVSAFIKHEEIIQQLYDNTSRDKLIKFVLDIDLKVGEVDFTEELVKKLMKSLVVDMPPKNKEKVEKKLNEFFKLLEE